MTRAAERYERIRSILEGARTLADPERAAHVRAACAGDESLRAEVEALLAIGSEDARLDVFADESIAAVRSELESVVEGAAVPWLPERIGDYEIVRQIGVGGMGVIYEARQASPRRRVAIKLLHPMHATPTRLRRFRREAELLGRLQHPGIAQIFEAGTFDVGRGEQPFFAMELVDGVDVRTYCERGDLGLRQRVKLLARIADAVHYAHTSGVIHRDLKPDNVLVTPAGDPRILDFGIARAKSGSGTLSTVVTEEGQLVGTLAYMAPEQLGRPGEAGESDDSITPHVDVYALGVLGFELLVGRLPRVVEGLPLSEAVVVLTRTEPPRAGMVDARLRGDVETILGKALESEPKRRYATAAELAEDLRLFLLHRPIHARPPSGVYLVRKFAKRHKALVGGTLATLVVSVVGAFVATLFAISANDRATELERASYVSGIAAAASAVVQQDYDTAEFYLDRTPVHHRGWEYDYLRARLVHHSGAWETPAWLRGNPVFDAAGGRAYCATLAPSIVTWDIATGKLLETHDLSSPLETHDLSSPLETHDLSSPLETHDLSSPLAKDLDSQVPRVVLHGPTRRFAARSAEREISIGEIGGLVQARITTSVACEPLAWSASGSRLLYSGDGLFVWEDGRTTKVAAHTTDRGRFSPSGDRVVVAIPVPGRAGAVASFDVETGAKLAEQQFNDTIGDLEVSPDGAYVAVCGDYRNVYVLDARTLEVVENLPGHRVAVHSVAWSPDSVRLVSVSADGTARVWDRSERWSPTVLPIDAAGQVAILPDGERFVVAGEVLRTSRFEGPRVLTAHESFVYRIEFSPDGAFLVSGGFQEQDLLVWDVQRNRLARKLPGPRVRSGAVWWSTALTVFSSDSTRLFAGSQWGTRAWDVRTWEPLPVSETENPRLRFVETVGGEGGITHPRLSSDGRRLASLLGNDVVIEEGVFEWPDALFTEDGMPVLSPVGGEARTLHGVLEGHTDTAYCAAFSPDGKRIATGGNDKTVRIWDAETCELLLVLHGHEQYVYDICFSPDGTLLASASGDTTVRLWDTLPPHERRMMGSK